MTCMLYVPVFTLVVLCLLLLLAISIALAWCVRDRAGAGAGQAERATQTAGGGPEQSSRPASRASRRMDRSKVRRCLHISRGFNRH